MGASFKVDIKPLLKIKKELEEKMEVRVGIFQENDLRPDGKSNVEIGMDHEFGNPLTRLPMRSWLRVPLIQRSNQLLETAYNSIKNWLEYAGKLDLKKAYKAIGKEAEHIIQGGFESGGYGEWKPISDFTAAKKGNTKILIEYGFLKRAVKSKVVKK